LVDFETSSQYCILPVLRWCKN